MRIAGRPKIIHHLRNVKVGDKCNAEADKLTAVRLPKKICCTSPHCCKEVKTLPDGKRVTVHKPRVETTKGPDGNCARCGWIVVWGYP
jgi:hypothetical protein